MKIIEPVLFPFTADELEILRYAGDHFIKDYDVLINYNYQKKHYEMLEKYIDPDLAKECLKEIDCDLRIRSRPFVYMNYLQYFTILASKEKGNVVNKEEMIEWLKKTHDFTFRMFKKPNYIFSIEKIYNTIIIPKIPSYTPLDNTFNRMYGLIPNYFNIKYIVRCTLNHLVEGGNIYILDNNSYWEVRDVLVTLKDRFKIVSREPFIIQKKIKPKKELKLRKRNWLY